MKRLLVIALIAVVAVGCAGRKKPKAGAEDMSKPPIEDRSAGATTDTLGGEGDLSGLDGSAQTTPMEQGAGAVPPSGAIGGGAIGSAGGPLGDQAMGAGGAGGAGGSVSGGVGSVSAADQAALKDPSNPLGQRSIYFDYDSFVVREEYRPVVQAHAQLLSQNPNLKVFLQGHGDERGSREYNLALGQRRADAVRKMMSVMGVTDAQVESISFGEEKPRAQGHNEEAWRENRRADIVYQGE